jgi:hypothetical protein
LPLLLPLLLLFVASMQLYKEAGVPTKSFVGVPVFQAEGLTVTTQDMVRAPLHFHQPDKAWI